MAEEQVVKEKEKEKEDELEGEEKKFPIVNEADQSLNSQAKNLPWVQDMAKRLKELENEKKEREEKERKALADAEVEKAKAEKRYEDALKLQRDEAEKEITVLRASALRANVEAKLLSKGAVVTDGLVKVAMAEYDAEKHDTVDAFIEHLSKDENYAAFFSSDKSRPAPPGKLSVTGNGTVNWEQVKAWEHSSNREERIKARDIIRDWRAKNDGKFPY